MNPAPDQGERALVRRIRRLLGCTGPGAIGDDCAVVPGGPDGTDWVLTSDPVIEGVHFAPATPPEAVAHKALGRVLSDIAAMGASPAWALVDLTLPQTVAEDFVDRFYTYAVPFARQVGMQIAGGDLGASQELQVHVFATGTLPAGTARLRSGANPGHRVYVTGSLGGSLASGHHLNFTPRIREGLWLRDHATAMMDISDGIAMDLTRMAEESGVGFDIRTAAIPCSDAIRDLEPDARIRRAISDGEDFELLFTLPAETEWTALNWPFDTPVTEIGMATDHPGIIQWLNPANHPIDMTGAEGYEHFTARSGM